MRAWPGCEEPADLAQGPQSRRGSWSPASRCPRNQLLELPLTQTGLLNGGVRFSMFAQTGLRGRGRFSIVRPNALRGRGCFFNGPPGGVSFLNGPPNGPEFVFQCSPVIDA